MPERQYIVRLSDCGKQSFPDQAQKREQADAENSHIEAVAQRSGDGLFDAAAVVPSLGLCTVGSRTTARELVTAEGKKIKGRAMPVRTPYRLRASEWLSPKAISRLGTKMASRLCRQFKSAGSHVGTAIAMRGPAI